jgi:hypothetical protein
MGFFVLILGGALAVGAMLGGVSLLVALINRNRRPQDPL